MTEQFTLEHACLAIVDCEHKTAPVDPDGQYFAVGTPAMRGNRIDLNSARRISAATFKAWTRRLTPQVGDLLFAREAPVGPVVMIPDQLNVAPGQRTVLLRPNTGLLYPRFLYYLLCSPPIQRRLLRKAEGSTVPHLNVADVRSFELPVLPEIREQRAIAATLGALDDKIESNRRLADLAGALINARAQRMLDVEQVHSRQLGEVVEFNAMSTRPGEPDQEIIYIDIASVSPGEIGEAPCLPWAEAPSRARRKLVDGDVIYSTVRPGRRSFSQVLDPDPRTVVSTGFAVMTPGPEIGSSLLTTVAGSTEFAEYLESVAHGSAYPAVSVRAMGQYNLLLPDLTVVRTFETDTMPLRRRVAHAKRESAALANLRDALLPELLSGQIKVSEAQETIEESIDEEVPHG